MGARNLLVTRLAAGRGTGNAYLSPPWAKPEKVSDDVLVTRCGDTWVALVTEGGVNALAMICRARSNA